MLPGMQLQPIHLQPMHLQPMHPHHPDPPLTSPMPPSTRGSGPSTPTYVAAASRQRTSACLRIWTRAASAPGSSSTSDMPQVKPMRWRKAVKRRERAAVMVEVRSAPYSSCRRRYRRDGTGGAVQSVQGAEGYSQAVPSCQAAECAAGAGWEGAFGSNTQQPAASQAAASSQPGSSQQQPAAARQQAGLT